MAYVSANNNTGKIDEKNHHTSTPIDNNEENLRLNNLVDTPLLPMKSNSNLSLSSTITNPNDHLDICRICHCEGTNDEPLITPCNCLGTMKYLHQSCLQQWIKSAGIKSCELCKFEFIMHSEIKPFKQWRKLDMNVIERRKVMCSVAFNLIAGTCVLWSLYILIEKTREEMTEGKLQWPFWTKIIVVAIGFTGALIFLYIQCKMYIQLCMRWRQFNQRIVIHSISEQEKNTKIQLKGKTSNKNCDDVIIQVLNANDLSPLNVNTTSTVTATNEQNIDSIRTLGSSSSTITRINQ